MFTRIKNHFDRKKRKKIYIQIVCDETGWTKEEAKRRMDAQVEKGISYNTYVTRKFYQLNEKQSERRAKFLERKDREYVSKVCDATGWTKEHAIKEMERVKERLKLSYFKYYSYRFFSMTDDEMDAKLEEWRSDRKKQIETVKKESGWDTETVKLHMRKVRSVYDIPQDYYVLYRMWELSDEQIETYARRKDSDMLFKKYNDKKEAAILSNKELFNREYKDYIKRKFWVNKNTNFNEFQAFIEGLEYIFCKPVDSGGGQGTEKICLSEHTPEVLYEYLMAKDKLLVEECVVQHPEIDKFAPGCVNTVRVITLLKDDVCNFICSGIRIGNSGIVDNFHKDGMVCDVDLETGTIITDAIDRMGVTYEKHPKSGYQFKGFKIPNWEMVLKLAEDAIRVQQGVNYVGWDIAVCEDKAVIIEGNSAPDLVLIQAPYAKQKIGKKYLFEQYL